MKLSCYYILCAVRIIFTLLPQTGYIHPDEHFQGPEIVYGDIFNFKIHQAWEFTDEKPIRNIAFPYFITGFPSLVANFLGIKYLHGTFLFPYFMLVLPRIIMCSLSFLNDVLIYKTCVLLKKNFKMPLLIFASSYITIVYLIRAFSNCLEVLFFSHVISILCKFLCMLCKFKNPNANDYVTAIKLSFILGVTFALGIFNRPTFVCFAAFPVSVFLFFLLRMQGKFVIRLSYFASFCMGISCIALSFIAVDSFYYNKIHYSSLNNLYEYITITPLNFILYNIDNKNLNSHGLHSRWLHICVNIPLLFSTCGILVLLYFLIYLSNIFKQTFLNFEYFLLLSFAIPLFFLSLIPHQEPRFLLPLLFPLALLHSVSTFNKHMMKNVFICIWIIHNIFGVLLFGFFHQGGVYSSLAYIHSSLQSRSNSAVIFYKTYMPPRYVLGLTERQKDISIHDFAGIDEDGLEDLLNSLILQSKPQYVYAIIPHEMSIPIQNLFVFQKNYKFVARKCLFPHLSTESLPKLSEVIHVILSKSSFWQKMTQIKRILSIHVLIFKTNI